MTDDDKLQEHVDAAAARGVHIVDMLGRPLSAKDIRDMAHHVETADIRTCIDAFRDLRSSLTVSNGPTHTITLARSACVNPLPDPGPTAAQRKQARQRQRKARKQNRG